ncbi:MAG: mshA 7 [Gemmataceae bacterium]|nr:mshA 7 [Gemmataceae bacterium]
MPLVIVSEPSPPSDPSPRRWARVRLVGRAVRHKLRAVSALGTFWPAVARGGKLLVRGQLRAFAAKLLNEMSTVRAAELAPVRAGPPLFLAGHILRPGGYDHVVYALLKGLLDGGVNVRRDPWSVMRPELIPPGLHPGEMPRHPDHSRLAATPPHLLGRFRPDGRTAAFTMWETDTLPGDAIATLNRCGLVVVPSSWGADCFRANGVTVPMEVVPLGYDPEVFRPSALGDGCCVFGTAGALDAGGLRKNVQRVIDLFRRAFPVETDARLWVKITPSSPPVRTSADPRIEVVQRSLSPAELADWYRSLTAFVNGSFGEGFGLHLLEAMACGRPLISTTFGGVTEFFDRAVGYEVKHQLVEARNTIYSGRWADPDDGEMIGQMRRVYRDRGEARRLGELAAGRAARFTWAETIRVLVTVLRRYGFLPTSPPQRPERAGE